MAPENMRTTATELYAHALDGNELITCRDELGTADIAG